MSSDTPLTDAKVFLTRGPGFNSVDPNFARTLERRVSQLEAELQSAEQVIEKSAGQPGSYLYTQRLEKRVTQLEAQLAEARKDSERLAKADRLALYDGKDGHREWWSGGTWLYPGDEIIQLDAKP
jgi:hypothetical protein